MKWINAEQKVTVTVYDEEHEEHRDKIMSVEEMLDTYTNEGCPTMYSNPERKTGRWKTAMLDHEAFGVRPKVLYCSECNQCIAYPTRYCPNCGAKMKGEQDGERMTQYIILSKVDIMTLCKDAPVTVYIENKPYIICTDEYFEKDMRGEKE